MPLPCVALRCASYAKPRQTLPRDVMKFGSPLITLALPGLTRHSLAQPRKVLKFGSPLNTLALHCYASHRIAPPCLATLPELETVVRSPLNTLALPRAAPPNLAMPSHGKRYRPCKAFPRCVALALPSNAAPRPAWPSLA